MSEKVSFLILDYRKEAETRLCLESIRRHAKIPHKIIYLDNGGREQYPWSFYQEGLCDVLISKYDGGGGGVGQTDLFRYCDTRFAYFIQSDQMLTQDITENIQDHFEYALDNGFRCLDLNGDQSGKRIWTDRAHMIDVGFFNSLAPFPRGGPGPYHTERWVENYLQEVFRRPENRILHVKPTLFADNGKTTIRELPCGGIVMMRTDTKAVSWLKAPMKPYIFPEHTEDEWAAAIAGEWVAGTVPSVYLSRGESFKHWD